ncbi:hypothetical protein FH972_003664 [Carpinus fangiana]|uniref:Uncharacterized protein n=1 Tax=Carpinus fangiana TaxID=176857 RepID=A0A5N6QKM6_9ROSI|nr:hypothetical protein FH972_003664 [Carpinus fangiana]
MEYSTYNPTVGYPIEVIVSGESNLLYDSSGHLLALALETIGMWNLRQGLCTKSLAPSSALPRSFPLPLHLLLSLK